MVAVVSCDDEDGEVDATTDGDDRDVNESNRVRMIMS